MLPEVQSEHQIVDVPDAAIEEPPVEYAEVVHKTVRAHNSDKPKYYTAGIIALCILSILLGIYMRTETTVFMERRALDGYLPAEEYVLEREDSGRPVQNIRSFAYRDTLSTVGNGAGLETSRGIRPGSSWEDVVDAYGDLRTRDIQVYKKDSDNALLLKGGMTICEFDEAYVKTGKVNFSEDDVGIRFSFSTDGKKICYNSSEEERLYQEYTNKLLHTKDLSLNEFCMSIVFLHDIEPGTVYHISSLRYTEPMAEKIF